MRILTAFINALVLVGLTAFIVRAAIIRTCPQPVQSPILIVMAVAGLAVNGAAAAAAPPRPREPHIRAATWHRLEDFFGWVAVLVGGIVIRLTGWYVIDPLLSIAVSAFVLWGAWSASVNPRAS